MVLGSSGRAPIPPASRAGRESGQCLRWVKQRRTLGEASGSTLGPPSGGNLRGARRSRLRDYDTGYGVDPNQAIVDGPDAGHILRSEAAD
jgi:hypothetical protein